ncbi:hypothetical protein TM_1829 [Thermotoga maritima MSB8]|uniref:Uncharacterized protein n=1 Tax=Thermotoga maritima (strain ATCC 43589 / DSM 3109 / JCM 10099 / NBRC 100826 / MSB8) TaxID=243274 RepID=Q9X2E9_THEMA|nr:hypothetical protein TM_1829 [Thermotoga maritima MSB8]
MEKTEYKRNALGAGWNSRPAVKAREPSQEG